MAGARCAAAAGLATAGLYQRGYLAGRCGTRSTRCRWQGLGKVAWVTRPRSRARELVVAVWALRTSRKNTMAARKEAPMGNTTRGEEPSDPSAGFCRSPSDFSTPRAHSPCKIALYPGHAPFWARRRARRNLGVHFRLIRAVSTRRAGQSCTDPRSEPNRVGASPMAARARTREVLRPDRGPAVEARSPPTQMSCGVEPEL